ncbi:MAG: ROK family protein [Acidaminococcaceae bacterium]|nr:ROK family protein [Acidaminococcaceae bacterium]
MKHYMCFDIGGTSVKFGVAGESGALLHKGEIPNVITQKGVDGLVESLTSVTKQYQQEYSLHGIAVSTAGVVDPEKGLILYAPKYFPGYPGTALGERLEKCCSLPCTVENDVNAAALGEYWLGAGQGAKSLFCITVGTGIGGCALLDGRVLHGAACFGGEAGLQHITPGSTWEEMASTRALVRNVAEAKGIPENALDGRKIFALAQGGDEEAAAAIARQMDDLATGIANICYILNPERIIVGGGIAAQEAYLYPQLDTALRKKLFPLVYEKLTLRFAALQNDAGMLGALYNFLMRQ